MQQGVLPHITAALSVVHTARCAGLPTLWCCCSNAAALLPPLQIATAVVLAVGFEGDNKLDHGTAVAALVLICIYVAAFAWSW